MKKWIKSIVSMLLVFSLVVTFSPVTASAKGGSPKALVANTGYVNCVYYTGGPVKKAKFSITSTRYKRNQNGYDVYDVTITINKPQFSQKDVIGIYNDLKKKGNKSLVDYVPVFTNKNGGTLTDIRRKQVKVEKPKPTRTYAKIGKKKIWIDHTKYIRYDYKVYVPTKRASAYVGVAGLGYGQLKPVTYQQYCDGKITYGPAGFGSPKSGFVYISQIK